MPPCRSRVKGRIARVSSPPSLASALVAAGADDSNPFSLKLALGFFAAFGLGLVTDTSTLAAWSASRAVRAAALCVTLGLPPLVGLNAVAEWMDENVADLYEFAQPSSALVAAWPPKDQWIPRLCAVLVAVLAGSAALLCLPNEPTWYSAAGEKTMYSYLLHVGVIAPLSNLKLAPHTERTDDVANALLWVPLSLLLPLLIAYVLTTRPVRLIFWPLVEPTWVRLLLRRPSQWAWADLAPADLQLTTRAHFARWALGELVVLAIMHASVHWRPELCAPTTAALMVLAAVCHWCQVV
jgi:hypothetical protein